MASGSRGFKDFGLSSNMTMPITNASSIEPDPKVMAQHAFMPEEREQKSKKHARFAPDKELQVGKNEVVEWLLEVPCPIIQFPMAVIMTPGMKGLTPSLLLLIG